MKNKNQRLGAKGEDLACEYLKKKGYTIVERNWWAKTGEIDIVAKRGGVFVFVEVKTRNGTRFGQPEEAITAIKRERMHRSAEMYRMARRVSGMCRMDVIAIVIEGTGVQKIEHFENI